MDKFFQKTPYKRFVEFTSLQTDRYALLCLILDECSLPHQMLEIKGKRHIAVPGWPAQKRKANMTILTAHYDRTAGSPGANDNTAAVFQLIETAYRLTDNEISLQQLPVLFVFTDGEELSEGESLYLQGSYNLGLYIKESGLRNCPIFSFDACGTGDTLIISTAADQLIKNEIAAGAETTRRKVRNLRRKALEAARNVRLEKVQLLPTPFSEDAGFLLAGIAAQTITVLPSSEAALVRRELPYTGNTANKRLIPETWRILNGPGDSLVRLTPEYWKKITAFMEALSQL